MIEILFCENGQHNWERESKRGKKPKNCPSHMPTPAQSVAVGITDRGPDRPPARLLHCQYDGHEWWAPVQRGRPPRFCPEHRPPKPFTARQRSDSLGKERANEKHGFDDLSASSLEEVIRKYKEGLESDANYPCGSSRPQVEKWLAQAESVLESKQPRELYCHAGDHTYQAERKRGKPPRNCPEHAVPGAIERKGELDQEKKEKAQKSLQDEITRLSARVEDAEIVDQDAWSKLEAAGGVNKADEEFKIWLRANTALLHEVESLRARERKLLEC